MESILSLIVNAENVRTLVIIACAFSCSVWVRSSIKESEHKIWSHIKEFEHKIESSIKESEYKTESSIKDLKLDDFAFINKRIDELKYNDFAHLKGTLEALTFVLEKNGSMSKEDKGFVDSIFPSPSPV